MTTKKKKPNKVTKLSPKKKVDKNKQVKDKKMPLKMITVTIQEKKEGGFTTSLDHEAVNRADFAQFAPLVGTVILTAALEGKQHTQHDIYAMCSNMGITMAGQTIQHAIAKQEQLMKEHSTKGPQKGGKPK